MRLLFISSNRIGDAVLSSGALACALERYPRARVTIACGPEVAPIYHQVPRLDRIISLHKRRYSGHWMDLWWRSVGRYWTVIIDLRRSAMRYLLPHKRSFIMPSDRAHRHKVEQVSAMMGSELPLAPVIWLAESHRVDAIRLVPQGSPVLAVAPTANWGGKEWPIGSFRETVTKLTCKDGILDGARVAVFSAPSERARALELLDAVPRDKQIDLAGNADLLTAFACLQRAAFFVGNDSALMHLSAAAGVPTLGLFGPSRAEHYGPWGENGVAVTTDLTYEEITGAADYDYKSHVSRMTSLSVEKVLTAADELWRRTKKKVLSP